MSGHSDLYAVLGVAPDATEKEIRDAYRLAARESHPDRRPGDPAADDRFKQVNAAYEVLADPARRADYDRRRRVDPTASAGRSRRRPGSGPVTIPVRRVATHDYLRTTRDGRSRRSDHRSTPTPPRRRDIRLGRVGDDLTAVVPITYPEAVLGAEITVPLLDGEQVTVRVPPGTASGRRLRIRGRGAASPAGRGDLHVTVEIIVPRQVGEAERRAIRALADAMDHAPGDD